MMTTPEPPLPPGLLGDAPPPDPPVLSVPFPLVKEPPPRPAVPAAAPAAPPAEPPA